MPIPDDADPETLICHLAGPLPAFAREEFRRAAEDALTRIPCWGEGAVYRAVAALQCRWFVPPSDWQTNAPMGPGSRRASRLVASPALADDSPRCGERDRKRFRVGA